MRLTLRTLLAYLDDTLEPLEIKPIGQKVAESDAAQELIARIKQVTRRRRLTTPPDSGPNQRFDANVVAEYLDNELSSEEVAELEKLCLESDVHLAEIASCHQILTLVLGQPALVPPTARERMYGLVQGKEAIRSRRAVAAAPARSTAASSDGDDLVLLGLPARVRTSWARVLLPVAGVLLLLVLGAALYLALPRSDRQVVVAPTTGTADKDSSAGAGQPETPKDPDDNRTANPKPSQEGGNEPDSSGNPSTPKVKPEDTNKGKPPADEEVNPFEMRIGSAGRPISGKLGRKGPPSKERAAVGRYYVDNSSGSSILVAPRGNDWRRLANGDTITTATPLVCLPGYSSEIRLNNDVHLLLRGHLPELTPPGFELMRRLLESCVVLHKSADADLDLTLQRGRVYISNRKDSGPAHVHLRFLDKQWDVTLKTSGARIGVEIILPYNRELDIDKGEPPDAVVVLWVMLGEVELIDDEKQRFPMHQVPSDAFLYRWMNMDRQPAVPVGAERIPAICTPDIFLPTKKEEQKAVRLFEVAMREVSSRMAGDRTESPLVALRAILSDNDPQTFASRLLAIYACAALDHPREVIEALNKNAVEGDFERVAAVTALRGWLNQDPRNAQRLYDPAKKQGLLIPRYKPAEADTLVRLLHDVGADEQNDPDRLGLLADYLQSDQVAIAELAWEHLATLGGPVLAANKIYFNAANLPDERQATADKIRKLIHDGKLPPRRRQAGARESEDSREPPERPGRPEKPDTGPGKKPAPPRKPMP